MTKRCVAIHYNHDHLCAVQLAQTDGSVRLEKFFSSPLRRDSDTLASIKNALYTTHRFDKKAPTAITLPQSDLLFKNIDIQKTQHTDPYWLNEFPVPLDNLIIAHSASQTLPTQNQTSLVTAADTTTLKTRRDQINLSRLRHIDAPIFALHALAVFNHPDAFADPALILHLNHNHLTLALATTKNIPLIRNLPMPSINHPTSDHDTIIREIELTFLAATGHTVPPNLNVCLTAQAANNEKLLSALKDKLLCKTFPLNPFNRIDPPEKSGSEKNLPADSDLPVAMGLALRTLNPENTLGVNLQNATAKKTNKYPSLKKNLTLAASLLAAIALVATAKLFISLNKMESQHTAVKNEINLLFRQTLPNVNLVNPHAQLTEQLQITENKLAALAPALNTDNDPLNLLALISANTPQSLDVRIQNIQLSHTHASITADADMVSTVYQWQSKLKNIPKIASVEVNDPARNRNTKRIHFNIRITLNEVPK